ncbi:disks large homolog 1-like isoform X1 [Saccoglossus kowalevskii]
MSLDELKRSSSSEGLCSIRRSFYRTARERYSYGASLNSYPVISWSSSRDCIINNIDTVQEDSEYRYHDDELPPPPELGPDTTPRLVPVLGSNVDRKVENVQTYVQQSRVSPPRAAPAPVRLHADQVKETSSPEDQYPSPPPLVSTAPRPIPVPIPTPPSPPLLAASSPQPPPFVNGVGEDDWEYEEITLKRVSKYVYLNRLSYSIHVLDQVCL